MYKKFRENIDKVFPFLYNKRLGIAVSGGVDSVVLLDLIIRFDIATSISVLHCNFNLRGEESNEDQKFVEKKSIKVKMNCLVKSFDTLEYIKLNKSNVQEGARELRYNWFYKLLNENKFDYILLGHHLGDSIETFFINLSRGTGIRGLTGISGERKKIIRPLLPFTKDQIKTYAQENEIKFREDSSNLEDKYVRNKIRHHVLPILKSTSSEFFKKFQQTLIYINQVNQLVEIETTKAYRYVAIEKKGLLYFSVSKLKKLIPLELFLFEFFDSYGFKVTAIRKLIVAKTGKYLHTDEYTLLKNREYLILKLKEIKKTPFEIIVNSPKTIINSSSSILVKEVIQIDSQIDENCIFVNKSILKLPLVLRNVKQGDVFYPSGMIGKKKINKYYKDIKLNLFQKAEQLLLCDTNSVVWVVGRRMNRKLEANNQTKNILKISVKKNINNE